MSLSIRLSAFVATSVGLALSAAAQPAPAGPPAVGVVRAERQQITQTDEFIGRIQAVGRVALVARVSAFLEKRLFVESAEVKKGDLLYQLEEPPFQAQVENNKANVAQLEAQHRNAQLTLERAQYLLKTVAGQQSNVDSALASERSLAAQIEGAKAQLQIAEINLGYTEIRSPIDGRIGLAIFTVGNLVQPSSGKLATIVSQDPIYVIFQVSQRNILTYRQRVAQSPEQSAHVTIHIKLPNGSLYPHPGLTNFLDVQVDPTTDTVAIRAQVPNPEGLLIAGGVVGVTVERGAPRLALMIPQAAVLLDQAGRYVLMVGADKKVEQRRITTGVEQGRDVVVTDGLKEGELVIVEGVQKVRPGQIVTANVVAQN